MKNSKRNNNNLSEKNDKDNDTPTTSLVLSRISIKLMFECETRFSQPHLSTYVLTLKLHRKLSTSVTQKVISRIRNRARATSRGRARARTKTRTRTTARTRVRDSRISSAIECQCRKSDSYAVSLPQHCSDNAQAKSKQETAGTRNQNNQRQDQRFESC